MHVIPKWATPVAPGPVQQAESYRFLPIFPTFLGDLLLPRGSVPACDSTEYIVQSKYQDMVQIPEYRVQRTGVQSTEHRVRSALYRLQRREIGTEYKVQQTDCGVQSTRTSTEHPGKQKCSSSWTSRTFYFLDSRDLLEVLGDFLGRERGGVPRCGSRRVFSFSEVIETAYSPKACQQ